ncbi:MAG: VIT1/CCC1 transporter family protein [Promethearchaeia archaeon]
MAFEDQFQEQHIAGGGKIRSIILGFNDGLISVFTLLIGVATATYLSTGDNFVVVLTGFAAMVSGAFSMGLGEYISSKSEAKYIQNEIERENAEIELFPDEEKMEVSTIFKDMGFEGELLDAAVEKITSDKETWKDFLVSSELGLEEPESPVIGAILTFFSFLFGAFISIFPYLLDLGIISLILSSLISFSMLFIAGSLKTKITGESPWKSGIEMVIVGFVAFIASYLIGIYLEP